MYVCLVGRVENLSGESIPGVSQSIPVRELDPWEQRWTQLLAQRRTQYTWDGSRRSQVLMTLMPRAADVSQCLWTNRRDVVRWNESVKP